MLAIAMRADHEEIQRNLHHDCRFLTPSSLKAGHGVRSSATRAKSLQI